MCISVCTPVCVRWHTRALVAGPTTKVLAEGHAKGRMPRLHTTQQPPWAHWAVVTSMGRGLLDMLYLPLKCPVPAQCLEDTSDED